MALTLISQIGYPVLTVKETANGIVVRQDRFLDTGDVKEDENQTIWYTIFFLSLFMLISRPQASPASAVDRRRLRQVQH